MKQIDNRQKQQVVMRAQKASMGGKKTLTGGKDKAKDFVPSEHEQTSAQNSEPKTQQEITEIVHRDHPKVGRNETCPCGSGKKYKKCCL